MMCPVHEQPDCSAILNGCTIVSVLAKGQAQVGFEIRATHQYGFRYGHEQPWGTVVRCVYDSDAGRPVYVIEFPDEKVDRWPVEDPSDPYEFRSPEGLHHATPVESPVG
jgi:hypothetical protein